MLARRKTKVAYDLRDVFGWSLPFDEALLGDELADLMRESAFLRQEDGLLRSTVRVATLGDDFFLHSAYPTTDKDAVFFGPDSYRFAAFVQQELPHVPRAETLVDIGAGTGVGGVAALRTGRVKHLIATEINSAALDLLSANFEFLIQSHATNGCVLSDIECNALDGLENAIDCVIANPPYIADPAHRAYRDGGGMHGGELSLTWARDAAQRLSSGGAFLLYTGSAIVAGEDKLKAALFNALDGFDVTYREIDPDVFGEELEREDYADVDRIAVVGLVAVKR